MAESMIPWNTVERRLREIEKLIEDLKLERGILMKLKPHGVEVRSGRGKSRTASTTTGSSDGKLGPSEAVMELVRGNPGMKTEQIADALHGAIKTKSSNPRRIVVNTVTNLATRKRLKADLTGGWIVAD